MHKMTGKRGSAAQFGLSLAALLFVVIFALAALFRLVHLSALPLSPDEASSVLVTWNFWQQPGADRAAAHLVSPGYFVTAAPLLALFGASGDIAFADALVRLAPALAGLLLVLGLWLARHELGLLASLTAAALLAVSPTAALFARTAGGDSWALLALGVLFLSVLRCRLGGGQIWSTVVAAACGFGLTTSPLFYTGALALVLAATAQRRFGPTFPATNDQGIEWRRSILTGAGTFVVVATFFLWRPAGLGGSAAILGQWLQAFSLPTNIPMLVAPLALLGRYELGATVIGAGALIWAVWRGYPLPQLLVYWYIAAFLLLLAQPGSTANVLVLLLPAYLLIGQWLQHLFDEIGEAAGAIFLFVLLVGVVVYFNGIRFVRLSASEQDVRSYIVLIALVIAFAALTINIVRSWDRRGAYQGTLLALLLLFTVYGWGTGWWLGREAANDPRAGLAVVTTDDDVRLLAELLTEVSYQTGNGRTDLPLLSAVDTPVLRWYLREFNAVQWGETVPPGTATTAIISAAPGAQPQIDGYTGLDLSTMRRGSTREGLPPAATAGETLRWWLFRESSATVLQENVILWVRQDALSWNRQ